MCTSSTLWGLSISISGDFLLSDISDEVRPPLPYMGVASVHLGIVICATFAVG